MSDLAAESERVIHCVRGDRKHPLKSCRCAACREARVFPVCSMCAGNIRMEAGPVEAVPSPDTKRLQHLEDWLDGFEFVHLPTQIEPEVRCDWFAGDGSGHWFTQGKTFREAIDKSLNHEATEVAKP